MPTLVPRGGPTPAAEEVTDRLQLGAGFLAEVRRVRFGLVSGQAHAVRAAGSALGLRGQGLALAPLALATRPKRAPLTLEEPTRTMRGVPAR
jgi:hypothetical protein